MDRELIGALGELGLSPTEAEVYVALVRQTSGGAVSAYALAKAVGRDPANTTKTLSTLERRGAVRVAGDKPRLYRPVSAADFTEDLLEHLQSRRRRAVQLLAKLGRCEPDAADHPLADLDQALERARLLLAGARRSVLADLAESFASTLQADLEQARQRGVTVLATSAENARPTESDPAPGPWLHLVVDEEQELAAVVDPSSCGALLAGYWRRHPALVFLARRQLAAMLSSLPAAAPAAAFTPLTPATTLPEAPSSASPAPAASPLQFVYRRNR